MHDHQQKKYAINLGPVYDSFATLVSAELIQVEEELLRTSQMENILG